MVALGLFLLLVSGVVIAAMVLQNTEASHASVFGQAVSGVTLGGLFAAGALAGAVAMLGLALMISGARRRRARRVGLKRQVRDVRDERETLAEENARLQRELDAARGADAYPVEGRHADLSTADTTTDTTTERHGLFHRS